ncbi:hypothetical protein QFZ38_004121 [Pseudomonas cedrina]|nr:hypothetical protein [Pseudomonas cedrina]
MYQTPPTNLPPSIRRLYALPRLANQKYNGDVTSNLTTQDGAVRVWRIQNPVQ